MRVIGNWIGVSLWIYALFLVVAQIDIGRIAPLSDSTFIEDVRYCTDANCTQTRPEALPFVSASQYDGPETHFMVVDIPYDARPDTLQALYFPKFSDHLTVTLNGLQIYAPVQVRPLWNEPLLIPVSPQILQAGANRLALQLSGPLPGHLDLRPFYLGDHKTLFEAYNKRFFMGTGLARFVLGLMVMFTVGYLVLWARYRSAKLYLWLGLSCACAIVFLLPLAVSFPMGDYRVWRLVQTGGMVGYVYFMLKFTRPYLRLAWSWLETVLPAASVAGLLLMCVIPIQYVYTLSLLISLVAISGALQIVVLFWQYRDRVAQIDFLVFFPTSSLALTFAFDALLLWLADMPPRSMHMLHIMPLFTSLVCFWLVLSQLVRSLSDHQSLTETLHQTVADKSRALEATYARLADAEKINAVNVERKRIMRDLHDGLGGQLVSTLAYLESKGSADQVLNNAIKDALRDLAMILDSMENEDSLVTMLGMLRTRLEGLLAEHGLRFNWQIIDDPVIENASGSVILQAARIVQEAITNVIKHADATVITVRAERSKIVVADDGKGYTPESDHAQNGSGHGIIGMQRRAREIGALLRVDSDPSGTTVTLYLDKA